MSESNTSVAPSDDTVFVFGAGFSGREIGRAWVAAGARVFGTTRSAARADVLRASGIEPLIVGEGRLSNDAAAALATATHLVACAGPDESGDPLLRWSSGSVRAASRLRWIGYLSTVGVYGDRAGDWVTEDADPDPRPGRSTERLAAERAWLDIGRDMSLPVAILRLSGIYGPGRNAFANLEAGTARRIVKKDQVFNRIHVADIAGATLHLADRLASGLFNVTDDLPAPPQDVVAHAANVMGVAPPPEIDFEVAEMTPMARSFYGENKRVSNARLKGSGYSFIHPDYRSALDSMWADGSWRASSAPAPSAKSHGGR